MHIAAPELVRGACAGRTACRRGFTFDEGRLRTHRPEVRRRSTRRSPSRSRSPFRPSAGVDRDRPVPRSSAASCRSSSSSRTMARLGADSCGRMRSSDAIVCRPDDPVDLVADVALELPDGAVGVGTEETVLLARIEAERVQLALQAHGRRRRGTSGSAGRACGRRGASRPRRADPTCRARPGRRPGGSGCPGRRARLGRWMARSARRARRVE